LPGKVWILVSFCSRCKLNGKKLIITIILFNDFSRFVHFFDIGKEISCTFGFLLPKIIFLIQWLFRKRSSRWWRIQYHVKASLDFSFNWTSLLIYLFFFKIFLGQRYPFALELTWFHILKRCADIIHLYAFKCWMLVPFNYFELWNLGLSK
jgi:hypothetical protein